MSSSRTPNTKVILIYLVIGLLVVAAVSIVLGGAGGLRLLRTLAVYGGAFLLLLYILRRARR